MEPSPISVFLALITSGVSILAIAADRFRNLPATTFAIVGGIAPWWFIALFDSPQSIQPFGLISSAPAFLIAHTLYKARETPRHRIAAVACIYGVGAGCVFSLLTFASMMSGFR